MKIENKLKEAQRWLKSSLKKKVSINEATVIAFMIAGFFGLSGISYSATVNLKIDEDLGLVNKEGGEELSKYENVVIARDAAVDKGQTQKTVVIGAGYGIEAKTWEAVVIGYDAKGENGGTTAVGFKAEAHNENSVAVGKESNAKANNAVSLGYKAEAQKADSIALGSNSVADRDKDTKGFDTLTGKETTIDAYGAWKSKYGALSIGNGNDNTRQITGVAAGSKDTDAVNLAQLKAATSHYLSVKGSSNADGNYANNGATGNNSIAIGVDAIATENSGIAIGKGAQSKAENAVVIGENVTIDVKNSFILGSNNIVTQNNHKYSKDTKSAVVVIGSGIKLTESKSSIAIGAVFVKNKITGEIDATEIENAAWTAAIGNKIKVKNGTDIVALGNNIKIESDTTEKDDNTEVIAIGNWAHAIKAKNSVLIGAYTKADTNAIESVIIGHSAKAESGAAQTVIIGQTANSNKAGTVVIGQGASASVANSVAIGSGSKTSGDIDNKGYDPSTSKASTSSDYIWKPTNGEFSVGDTGGNKTRRITGVAAGSADTDAVNVAQLKKVVGGSATLKYKANDSGEQSINLNDKSLNFKNGTYTTATVAADGVVTFDLNSTTKGKIDKIDTFSTQLSNKADKNLGNIDQAGENKVKSIALEAIDVQGTGGEITVNPTQDNSNNKKTFTISLNDDIKTKINSIGTGSVTTTEANTVTGKVVYDAIKNSKVTVKANDGDSYITVNGTKSDDISGNEFKIGLNLTTLTTKLEETFSKNTDKFTISDDFGNSFDRNNNETKTLTIKGGDIETTTYKGTNLKTKIVSSNGKDELLIGFSETPEFKELKLKDGATETKITADDLKTIMKELGLAKDDATNSSGSGAGTGGSSSTGANGANQDNILSKDGLDGKSLKEQIEAIRQGTAGSTVYTDSEGNRLKKGKDGKFYKESDLEADGSTKNGAKEVKDVMVSLVDPVTGAITPQQMGNVASGIGEVTTDKGKITIGKKAITKDEAIKVTENLLTISEPNKLNKAVTVGDLQAVAQSGLIFTTNLSGEIHRPLGTTLSILGNTKIIENDKDKYEDTNILTVVDNSNISIKMAKSPIFDKVTLNAEQNYDNNVDNKDLITKGYLEKALDNFKIKVKANDKEISLGRGDTLEFKKGLNIDVELGDNKQTTTSSQPSAVAPAPAASTPTVASTTTPVIAKVKHELNSNLQEITSIKSGKDAKGTKISFEDDKITLSIGTAKQENGSETVESAEYTFDKDQLDLKDKKLTGVKEGEISENSKDAVNGKQLFEIKKELGLIKDENASAQAGNQDNVLSNDGLDNKTIAEKIDALRNGSAGSVVNTDKDGNRLVKKDGKFYKKDDLQEDGELKPNAKEVTDVKVSLVDPVTGEISKPQQMGNVASGLGLNDSEKEKEIKREKHENLEKLVKAKEDLDKYTQEQEKDKERIRKLEEKIAEAEKNGEDTSTDKSSLTILTNGQQERQNKIKEAEKTIAELNKTQKDLENSSNDKLVDKLVNGALNDNLNNVATVGDLKALADAGLYFYGNDDGEVHKQLSRELVIKGDGVAKTDSFSFKSAMGNINVKKNLIHSRDSSEKQSDMIIQLNKELKNMTSFETDDIKGEIKSKAKLDKDGLTLTTVDNKETKYKVDGIEFEQGTGVISGLKDLNDTDPGHYAANKEYVDSKLNKTNKVAQKGIKIAEKGIAGVANAIAMASLPQASSYNEFKNQLSAAVGGYEGTRAVALGFSGISEDRRFVYKASGSVNNKGNLAVGLGVGVMLGEQIDSNVNDTKALVERIKKLEKENTKIDKLEKENADIKKENQDIRKENAEIKEMLKKLLNK